MSRHLAGVYLRSLNLRDFNHGIIGDKGLIDRINLHSPTHGIFYTVPRMGFIYAGTTYAVFTYAIPGR